MPLLHAQISIWALRLPPLPCRVPLLPTVCTATLAGFDIRMPPCSMSSCSARLPVLPASSRPAADTAATAAAATGAPASPPAPASRAA